MPSSSFLYCSNYTYYLAVSCVHAVLSGLATRVQDRFCSWLLQTMRTVGSAFLSICLLPILLLRKLFAPVLNKPYGFCGRKLALICSLASEDIKQKDRIVDVKHHVCLLTIRPCMCMIRLRVCPLNALNCPSESSALTFPS